MATVFPRANNPYWPLPADFETLTKEGKRLARVNAVSITGRPEYDAAAWAFFRNYYLIPQGPMWYRTGFTNSPDSHYQWVMDWNTYPLLTHVAPRGTSKTTINLEDILRKVVAFKYWECVLFLAGQKFVSDRLGRLMDQIEHNNLIIDDFGKLKTPRGKGQWNRGSIMELTNGSKVVGFPIKGASLGTRPSGLIVLDDVEKSDEQVITPSDLREGFREFFFNAIYPMSQSPGHRIPIRVIGTLYNRRMFIYWLYKTNDSRIDGIWKRTFMNVKHLDWDVMGSEWQEAKRREIGATAFASQYMNDPGTAADHMLAIHPELNTYWLENEDKAAYRDPFNSQAYIVTHQLKGWHADDPKAEPVPIPQKVVRNWSETVHKMRRFITVDWASTTSPDSDYSVVHVMGFENDEAHKNTLYTLDIWWGKARLEELTRVIYQMALRWNINLVGVEQYPVQEDFYGQVKDALPGMYGAGEIPPRVIEIKFPPKVDKAQKVMGIEWRFVQFRVKLPLDRRDKNPGIERLFWEIENTTEDLALLDHDDCVDSLAMSSRIGTPTPAAGPDRFMPTQPLKMLEQGIFTHEATGLPVISGMNASEIPHNALRKMLDSRYDQFEEDMGITEDMELQDALRWMNLPESLYY